VPRLVLAKGNYFGFTGRPVFSRLIYPVPVPGGLGVHVTLDLAGRMRFGPDVEWIEREDYDVDASRALAFYQRHGISMRRNTNGWDSLRARDVGDDVRRDLNGGRPTHVVLEATHEVDPLTWNTVYRTARESGR